jgi:putative transposase
VTALCRRLGVTRAGFYAGRRRGESVHAAQDRTLAREIARLFALHHERYGSPRLYEVLRTTGWLVSRRRVARLMQQGGLRAKAVCGYRAKANIHGLYTRHPNRLWTTTVTRQDQVWVGDITYLKAGGTWRYLAIAMDQHSRRILAWSLTAQRSAAVTCAVLARAARSRQATG